MDVWAEDYKNKKQLVDECVEVHLALADSCLLQARGQASGFDGIDKEEAVQAARLAWSAMQRAKLFCFHPSRWIGMYNASDRYTTETLAGLNWTPGKKMIKTNPDQVTINVPVMWGDISREEALEQELVGRLPDGRMAITDKGWQRIRDRFAKMPEDRRRGLHEMIRLAQVAQDMKDTRALAIACSQIEDALYEETPEDTERMLSAYEDYGVHWPFPDPLPFDSCFFCFGRRLNLAYSPVALHTRVHPSSLQEIGVSSVYLLGYLVAWEGDVPFVFTALQFGEGDGMSAIDPVTGRVQPGATVGLIRTYEDEQWTQPMSLDPWVLGMLVRAINEHKNIIDNFGPTLGSKMARKKASKGLKQLLPLPAPFYMVNLKDELIAAPLKKPKFPVGRPTEWTHRWDVRGHECVRIERGLLPTEPRELARLKKRGYRIYEGMSLNAEDAGRLLKRGVRAPGPQEWIAVLSYWRDSCVKGPEDKPYIPAARIEPEGRPTA